MTRHAVGHADRMNNGTLEHVEAGGRELCLARTDDGAFYAVDELCTHEHAWLSDGDLLGCEIQCPLHGSIFDLATGEVRGLPAFEPTNAYATTVGADGTIYVDLPN